MEYHKTRHVGRIFIFISNRQKSRQGYRQCPGSLTKLPLKREATSIDIFVYLPRAYYSKKHFFINLPYNNWYKNIINYKLASSCICYLYQPSSPQKRLYLLHYITIGCKALSHPPPPPLPRCSEKPGIEEDPLHSLVHQLTSTWTRWSLFR